MKLFLLNVFLSLNLLGLFCFFFLISNSRLQPSELGYGELELSQVEGQPPGTYHFCYVPYKQELVDRGITTSAEENNVQAIRTLSFCPLAPEWCFDIRYAGDDLVDVTFKAPHGLYRAAGNSFDFVRVE